MKKIFLTITALLTLIIAHGQKTEYHISLNSGLFSFAGNGTTAATSLNFIDQTNLSYTDNTYGSKEGLCYGLSANIQRVTKRNFILGLDIGYEKLRSKTSIIGIWGLEGTKTYGLSANGQTYLNSDFINMYPFLGYRLLDKSLTLDLTAGIDIAHCLGAKDEGEATDTNGKKYESSTDRETIENEVRPRIQISTGYKKMGLYAGYSYGLANYLKGMIPEYESKARLVRFGLTYRIN